MKIEEKKKRQKIIIQSSFGPVENLESYLIPDWWKRIFNSMYLKTDGVVPPYQVFINLPTLIFD